LVEIGPSVEACKGDMGTNSLFYIYRYIHNTFIHRTRLCSAMTFKIIRNAIGPIADLFTVQRWKKNSTNSQDILVPRCENRYVMRC